MFIRLFIFCFLLFFVFLFIYLFSVCLFVYLFIYFLFVYLFIYLFLFLFVCLFVCLFIFCLFVCLFVGVFSSEIPEEAVTVFEEDGVLVQVRFLAELSNVLIVNAKASGLESRDASVIFNMPQVRESPEGSPLRFRWLSRVSYRNSTIRKYFYY